mmetsp:Transcript_105122/g.322271  ORF Transcript_105122/g.322271 Transcript_105122/m.322271 type:complete len:249 (+) Transcript_105122:360-1106(+)
MRSAQRPPTPLDGTFQSPMAMEQELAASPHTLRTRSCPRVIDECGAWIATTQRLGQPLTAVGGSTRATAKARVSQSCRRQPPPDSFTIHPGRKASAAVSPPLPAAQGPLTCVQPAARPKVPKAAGWLALSASSTDATMSAWASLASCTNRWPMARLQSPLAPRAAMLHSQCTFQKNVDTFTSSTVPSAGSGPVATGGVVDVCCPDTAHWHNRSDVWMPTSVHVKSVWTPQVSSTSSHAPTHVYPWAMQ